MLCKLELASTAIWNFYENCGERNTNEDVAMKFFPTATCHFGFGNWLISLLKKQKFVDAKRGKFSAAVLLTRTRKKDKRKRHCA